MAFLFFTQNFYLDLNQLHAKFQRGNLLDTLTNLQFAYSIDEFGNINSITHKDLTSFHEFSPETGGITSQVHHVIESFFKLYVQFIKSGSQLTVIDTNLTPPTLTTWEIYPDSLTDEKLKKRNYLAQVERINQTKSLESSVKKNRIQECQIQIGFNGDELLLQLPIDLNLVIPRNQIQIDSSLPDNQVTIKNTNNDNAVSPFPLVYLGKTKASSFERAYQIDQELILIQSKNLTYQINGSIDAGYIQRQVEMTTIFEWFILDTSSLIWSQVTSSDPKAIRGLQVLEVLKVLNQSSVSSG